MAHAISSFVQRRRWAAAAFFRLIDARQAQAAVANRDFRNQTQQQQQLRLAEAQRLLGVTNLSVSDIGTRVGWANPFHFSRIFRAKTGESPSAWRRRHQPDL